MISTQEFVSIFSNPEKETIVQFGKISPSYTSGRPQVIYDADSQTGAVSKALPYLSSYTPVPNDRVMIVKGVIVGKII